MRKSIRIIRTCLSLGAVAFLALPAMLITSCSDFFNHETGRLGGERTRTPQVDGNRRGKPFPPGFNPNQGVFSYEKMLANLGLNFVVPRVRKFRLNTELLRVAIEEADQTRGSRQDVVDRARERWVEAMRAFHSLAALPVGPLSDQSLRLKESLYAWPYSNFCGVDREVVKTWPRVSRAPELFTVKGLGALEYLLFESSLMPTCNLNRVTNAAVKDWSEKSEEQKRADRMAYARVVAEDLVRVVRELERHWDPEGLNYTGLLIDGSIYPNTQKAVNAMSDALFSVKEVKDLKLGRVLGLEDECKDLGRTCPELIEHAWSKLGLEAIEIRVTAFLDAFLGKSIEGDGFGFDDALVALGHQEIAEYFRREAELLGAKLLWLKSLGSMDAQVQTVNVAECRATAPTLEPANICSAFQSLKTLWTRLKTDFLAAMSLSAPPVFQGDSD